MVVQWILLLSLSPIAFTVQVPYRTREMVVQCELGEVALLYLYIPDSIALNESSIPCYQMYKHYYIKKLP
jgi:hypothetical protein